MAGIKMLVPMKLNKIKSLDLCNTDINLGSNKIGSNGVKLLIKISIPSIKVISLGNYLII